MPDRVQNIFDRMKTFLSDRNPVFSELRLRDFGLLGPDRVPGNVLVRGLASVLATLILLQRIVGCDDPDSSSSGRSIPEPPPPEIAVARELLEQGRYGMAQDLLSTLRESHSEHPSLRFLQALAVQKQKRYAVALESWNALDRIEVSYPERPHLDHYRGWCLFYLGRPEEAANAFRRHLDVAPAEPDSHFGLGVSQLELANPEGALASLDRAIEIDLGTVDRRRALGKAWIRRGDALWELDRVEDAAHSYHKGVIQFVDHYEGWAKLARAHDRLGSPEDAAWARREETRARARVGQVEPAVEGDG